MVPDRDAPLRPLAPKAGSTAEASISTVAVVRSDNRRGAVAEALALLDAEIRPILTGPAVVLSHLEPRRADPKPLSSLLDLLLSAVVGEVVVASGCSNAETIFDRSGFRKECWGRAVRFLDLPRDEERWRTIERPGVGTIRLAETVASAGCRIALTPIGSLKGWHGMPAGRRAMLGSLHPDDRSRFDGVPIRRAWPDLSVVEGPIGRFGSEVVAIAGIDPTAVDAVAASVLGLDRGRHAGVIQGELEPPRISVIGDPIAPEPVRSWRPSLSLGNGLRRDAGHGNPEGGS
ncbi:hypothetical protein [Tautonia rosea]|uniref:hypothetical protein n=1 Tax=Tautonia rosea TaxID=2728037 RepID=UPI001475FB6D|nr:hypothetical protein [Tautonia rosea]